MSEGNVEEMEERLIPMAVNTEEDDDVIEIDMKFIGGPSRGASGGRAHKYRSRRSSVSSGSSGGGDDGRTEEKTVNYNAFMNGSGGGGGPSGGKRSKVAEIISELRERIDLLEAAAAIDESEEPPTPHFIDGKRIMLKKGGQMRFPKEKTCNLILSQRVFTTPLLISSIFEELDLLSLRSARLVSREWHQYATAALSEKSSININKMLLESRSFASLPSITKTVIRNVYCDFGGSSNADNLLTPSQQLFLFSEKYFTRIRGITIGNSDGNDAIRSLRILLSQCVNLSTLHLCHFGSVAEKEDKLIDSNNVLLPNSLKLTHITIRSKAYIIREHLQIFLNKVISACGELTDLKIFGNYYPDLSLNGKLKRLTVNSCSHHTHGTYNRKTPYFDLSKLKFMIEQVAGSLEVLEFDAHDLSPPSPSNSVSNLYFCLPEMPKVQRLEVKGLYTYPFRSLKFLAKCPEVRALKLCGNSRATQNVDKLFSKSDEWINSEEGGGKRSKITSLDIGPFRCVEVLKSGVIGFPNVSRLTIAFEIYGKGEYPTTEEMHNEISLLFAQFSPLKLKGLDLRINYYCELCAFAQIFISEVDLIKGLKSLKIRNGELLKKKYDLNGSTETLESALLLTRNMDICELQNFHLEVSTAINLSSFIAKKKLPVIFTK